MRNKQSLLLASLFTLIISVTTRINSEPAPKSAPPAPSNLVSIQLCLSDNEVSAALQTLTSGNYDEQQKAVALLKTNAERSGVCRQQVITNLLSRMDQPNLDLTGGTPQFYLWHYGTRLLGDLKAVEALDLLVANFDLHDGSGFPLDHHPALVGVIDMGEVALPKLEAVLKDNPNPGTRQYAVFCIALIGGKSAHEILNSALDRESDACTTSCIRATLASFNNKRRPNKISDEGRTEWYSTFLCNG